jgi:protoporphyrinogen oxidase
VVEIDPVAKRLRLSDGGEDTYDALVTAMPIPELLRKLRPVPQQLLEEAGGLHHSNGLVVGVGVARPSGTSKCWTYFPEADAPFYRVTFLSNYSPKIAPEGHTLLLTETSSSIYKPEDRASIVDRVVEGLLATRLLEPADLDRIVTTYTEEVPYFYPVPTLTRDRALASIQPFLMKHDIYSRGRFGAWLYEASNMDHSVMQGVEVVDRLLLGEAEKTWQAPREATPTVRVPAAAGGLTEAAEG